MTIEKLFDKVQRLRRELGEYEDQIRSCNHRFSAPIPATRTISESIFNHYEGRGSDPEPVYTWIKKQERGYERKCEVCGYLEYTTKLKPKEFEPDFTK
jgi:hypothetical protein